MLGNKSALEIWWNRCRKARKFLIGSPSILFRRGANIFGVLFVLRDSKLHPFLKTLKWEVWELSVVGWNLSVSVVGFVLACYISRLDPILFLIIYLKLDIACKLHFQDCLSDMKKLPKIIKIENFMEPRILKFESYKLANSNISSSNKLWKPGNVLTNISQIGSKVKGACIVCKSVGHNVCQVHRR